MTLESTPTTENPSHLKVEVIVIGTTGIELCPTAWADRQAGQVLLDRQLVAAFPTEHCLGIPFCPWPKRVGVPGRGFMAADARVVLAATFVPYGNDIARRVPVSALREGRHIDTLDRGARGVHVVVLEMDCFAAELAGSSTGLIQGTLTKHSRANILSATN